MIQQKERETDMSNNIVATPRTSDGLRDSLFDALDATRNGTMTAQEAQAVCKICAQIINSMNMEIEFYKHIARHSETGTVPITTLKLGRAA